VWFHEASESRRDLSHLRVLLLMLLSLHLFDLVWLCREQPELLFSVGSVVLACPKSTNTAVAMVLLAIVNGDSMRSCGYYQGAETLKTHKSSSSTVGADNAVVGGVTMWRVLGIDSRMKSART
jgi:hypothetical protein